jgi:cell division protein ZapA
MDRRTVELRIGDQKVRVVSSASEDELHRLAALVSRKLGEVTPRAQPSQGLVLAAMALAHELDEERARRVALERSTAELLERLLGRIGRALEGETPPDSADDG